MVQIIEWLIHRRPTWWILWRTQRPTRAHTPTSNCSVYNQDDNNEVSIDLGGMITLHMHMQLCTIYIYIWYQLKCADSFLMLGKSPSVNKDDGVVMELRQCLVSIYSSQFPQHWSPLLVPIHMHTWRKEGAPWRGKRK